MEVAMTRIDVRHTFSALVVAALVLAFASGPVSASGATLVVQPPMVKQVKPRPEPSYFVPIKSPTITQAKKNGPGQTSE
jgi:hypothetical protein